MKIWLMRHGRAGTAVSDEKRKLTSEGAESVRRVAARMKALGLDSPAVYSSPLARAVETARLVVEAAGAESVSPSDNLKPGAGVASNLELLRVLPADRDVLLVGHQPDMGVLASVLAGIPPAKLDPASVVVIRMLKTGDPLRGEVECVVSPDDPA